MQIAVSSLGTSLDSWAGIPFGVCSQFLIVDTETMEFLVVSVPQQEQDPNKISLHAIRAIARQGAQVVIAGYIKDVCRQTLVNLGIEVIEKVERITVREAVDRYVAGGREEVEAFEPLPEKIAVASHGSSLDDTLSPDGEPCTSFLLVNPQDMSTETVHFSPADTLREFSINAVRAVARAGSNVVIAPSMRSECCSALRSLAIVVVLADEKMTVREAVEKYLRGELSSPSYP